MVLCEGFGGSVDGCGIGQVAVLVMHVGGWRRRRECERVEGTVG